jgi:hypothetical protein
MISGQEKVGCEECDHKGWIHSHEPFEIQQCDTCTGSVADWTDTKAAQAHLLDCGCDWPATDFQSLIQRGLFYAAKGTDPSKAMDALLKAHKLAADRRRFITNLPGIMVAVGMALRAYDAAGQLLGARQYLESVCDDLLIVFSLASTGVWTDRWLWHYEDGTVIGGKWRARPPGREMRLLQGGGEFLPRPDAAYLKKVSEYTEAIRALGGKILQVHDEMMISFPDDPEVAKKITDLSIELMNFQIFYQFKSIGKMGERLVSATPFKGKTWDDLSSDIFGDVLQKHAPNLVSINKAIEETSRRRAPIELDYKKIYAALKAATLEREKVSTAIKIDEAMKHLLEIHPDANIPKEGP